MANTHNPETKALFFRVLQRFAGNPKGVSEKAITYQFQTQHNRSPQTIKQWIAEGTGLLHRKSGRLIVKPGALFIMKDQTRSRPVNAPATIRQVRRNKGTAVGHVIKNEGKR